ncbi:RICIN domain-containing protein [Actinoplanes sp. NPDC026619]|uniref:RICIN domain-containing protein n=1 Tax=Actinoplanes sp. NPDC026619 TaxID=3155798 RepID=UPI0033F75664
MRKRTIWALFMTLLTAVAALAVAPAPAFASYYTTTVSVMTPPGYPPKMNIDILNGATGNRGMAQLWSPNGNNQQRWNIVYFGIYTTPSLAEYKLYSLKRTNLDQCLDKSMDRGNVNGAAVYQYDCAAGQTHNQLWYFVPAAGTNYGELRNREDGRCLDVRDYDYFNGAPLQVWDCSGAWNQLWNILP